MVVSPRVYQDGRGTLTSRNSQARARACVCVCARAHVAGSPGGGCADLQGGLAGQPHGGEYKGGCSWCGFQPGRPHPTLWGLLSSSSPVSPCTMLGFTLMPCPGQTVLDTESLGLVCWG